MKVPRRSREVAVYCGATWSCQIPLHNWTLGNFMLLEEVSRRRARSHATSCVTHFVFEVLIRLLEETKL